MNRASKIPLPLRGGRERVFHFFKEAGASRFFEKVKERRKTKESERRGPL